MSSEIEEILDIVDQRFKSFKRFEVLSSLPSDNHFNVTVNINRWLRLDRQFLCGTRTLKQEVQLIKRMKQEWEILEANLPNSIYVRAYDNRIDVMRAVVISLEGSPYSYGLFFFDIFFPKEYPSKPPQLYCHPNYALTVMDSSSSYNYNGNNCSIIYNAVRSMWDPKTSNMYSMLGFIQGKALMNSKFYSNNVDKDFLLSHKAMLSFLRYPPEGFEVFVRGYFRKYSHNILLKFKGKGSSDHKGAISRMFSELYNAFVMNGSYCKHLVHVLDNKEASTSSRMSSKKNPTGLEYKSLLDRLAS